jgi:hypothetical protein
VTVWQWPGNRLNIMKDTLIRLRWINLINDNKKFKVLAEFLILPFFFVIKRLYPSAI